MNLKHIGIIAVATVSTLQAHEHGEPGKHKHEAKPVISDKVMTGNGAFTYEANSQWAQTPANANLGPTHGGVVVDSQGLIYISTDGAQSIIVFKPDGTFVKKFGAELGGTHHLCIAKEGDKEYIYAAHLRGQRVVKMDLEGNIVLEVSEKTSGAIAGGFGGLTGVAVAPDGHIYVAMGYGSNFIHKFDASGKPVAHFGGRGGPQEKEKFHTCHTLSLDLRFGEPRLLICDREKRRLVHYSTTGKYLGDYATHLRRPCAVSLFGEFCAVAELESRAVILDKNGTPISFLGDNPDRAKWANYGVAPAQQKPGLFSAPHGLSFDKVGNLYVQDWNATGRATKLKLVK